MQLTEKFRPQNLNELVVSNSIKKLLESYIEKKEAPNLLLYSESPGTGKTTTTNILANTLGNEKLNIKASKERGIDIVRESIEPFIRTYSFNGKRKAVLLSECDQLTTPAQKSLKDLMEGIYVKNNYYLLTTNELPKIIKPIRSRCIELDFSHPPKDKIKERLLLISSKEEIDITEPDIDSIIDTLYPDIRKMTSVLESVANGIKIEEAIGSEMNFYELAKNIDRMRLKDIYAQIEKVSIIPFLHYLFKVYLNRGNLKGLNFVKTTIRDIMWNVEPKIAFIANFVKFMKK